MNHKIEDYLRQRGVKNIAFVDISSLPVSITQGFPNAVLFGVALSNAYLQKVRKHPDYVVRMIKANEVKKDEFNLKESQMDAYADDLAEYIGDLNYKSFSQSEVSNENAHRYDFNYKRTSLPNKTIALMAGWGWIGKSNLLIHKQWGSGFCMCSVLTDASLQTYNKPIVQSQCGSCNICVDICNTGALKGAVWNNTIDRDQLLDVAECTTCLQCMVACPYTINSIKTGI